MKLVPQWWRTHFLIVELALAILLALAFFWWSHWHKGWAIIDATLDGNRAAVYGAMASIFGSLLGFVITAVSIVLGFSTFDRLAIVRTSEHYSDLWRIFTASIRCLALATIISLLGLIYDRDKAPCHTLMYLTVYAVVLATFRLGRCIWILEQIISLVSPPAPKTATPKRQGSQP